MMTRFIEVGLFEDKDGLVTCMRLAKRLDKSMTSNPEMRAAIEGIRNNHDSVMTQSAKPMQDKNRTEENRVDKSRTEQNKVISHEFDRFWLAGMTKQSKQSALKAFTKQHKESKQEIEAFTDYLINDVQQRLIANVFGFDKMHPTTYLNQQRWHDDIVKPAQNGPNKFEKNVGALQNIQFAPHQQTERLTND